MTATPEVTSMLDQLLRRKDAAAPAGDPTLTIRRSGAGDGEAIARLAELDESPVPAAPVLLAEVGGEPWAAVSLVDLAAVADPFRPTAELVLVMIDRARAERHAPRGGRGRRVAARVQRVSQGPRHWPWAPIRPAAAAGPQEPGA